MYALTLDLGGTISSQHGTGIARTPWVSKQYDRLYPVFNKLKAIFDPRHLLNPGKIITDFRFSILDFRLWPWRSGFGLAPTAEALAGQIDWRSIKPNPAVVPNQTEASRTQPNRSEP